MFDLKKKVIYQIYPKSFNDSNGDGFGDLRGITEKLDYIKELGVDYIWLTPVFISPQRDNGYDVADYYNIDERFGTMDDFDELMKECKVRGIDVMFDMVFNHTSTEHKWFKSAIEGDKKYKEFYIFKEGKDGVEPTNWQSKFGGNAWEYVESFDEYYLHLFDKTQADLNWENKEVREEIFKIVNFWIEKGVKGFRFDVVNLISKPEVYENDLVGDGRRFYTDGPKIHEYLKELNENTFGKYEDIITVGEMSSTTIDNCIKYSSPREKELSMVFNFHHLKVDYKDGDKWTNISFDFKMLKELFDTWQSEMNKGGGVNALFWCNHDQPRIVSRFGDDEKYHKESSKMLATTIHMMDGIPYIYQGEEIGMTDPKFEDINEYRDVETLNMFNIMKEQGMDEKSIMEIIKRKSRDNSRTPMQWDDSIGGGFTKGTPWINLSQNYKTINAKNEMKDEDSIFNHYKKLISLRKELDVIAHGEFKMIGKEHEDVLAYVRSYGDEKIVVMNNFYGKETEFKIEEAELKDYTSKILLSNYKDSNNISTNNKDISNIGTTVNLRPYESVVYHLHK